MSEKSNNNYHHSGKINRIFNIELSSDIRGSVNIEIRAHFF